MQCKILQKSFYHLYFYIYFYFWLILLFKKKWLSCLSGKFISRFAQIDF